MWSLYNVRKRYSYTTSKSTVQINVFKGYASIFYLNPICQFSFLIYQGGSPDAGKERKRQQDLQNNYNLVWNEDELQTVPREDDEADGEVEVESFYWATI